MEIDFSSEKLKGQEHGYPTLCFKYKDESFELPFKWRVLELNTARFAVYDGKQNLVGHVNTSYKSLGIQFGEIWSPVRCYETVKISKLHFMGFRVRDDIMRDPPGWKVKIEETWMYHVDTDTKIRVATLHFQNQANVYSFIL